MYLGYVVSKEGISADIKKVEAVQCFPQPHDLTSSHSFLGLTSYYRRFVSDFSTVANPLYALTRKNIEFFWGQAQENAFQKFETAFNPSTSVGIS